MKIPFFKKKQEDKSKDGRIDILRQSLLKTPDNIRLRIKIAEACLAQGMKNEAIDEYKKAAQAYESKNLIPIAVALYKQVLEINPELYDIFETVADIQFRQGFIGDSVATLEALASKFYDRDMTQQAMEVIGRIKSIDPENRFFSKKAAALFEKFQPPVPSDRDKWKLVDEKEPEAASGKGEVFFDLEAALQSDDSIDIGNAQDGLADGSVISHEDIFKELKKSVSETDENKSTHFHFNLGLALERCSSFEEALEEYLMAENDYEDKVQCCVRIAVCYGALGHIGKAEKFIKKAFKAGRRTTDEKLDLNYEMAHIYRKNNADKKALKLFREISKKRENFKDVEMLIQQLQR